MCMIDITESINANNLDGVVLNAGYIYTRTTNTSNDCKKDYLIFKNFEIDLSGNKNLTLSNNDQFYSLAQSNHFDFKQRYNEKIFAVYNGNNPLIFCLVNNSNNIGVSTLTVDLNKYSMEGEYPPLFISSGMLSGCTVLCLHIQTNNTNKILFLHAGNNSSHNTADQNELLCTGLYKAVIDLLNLNLPAVNTQDIPSLMQNLYNAVYGIQLGILVYKSQTAAAFTDRQILSIPYNTDQAYGAGYCLITTNGIKMAGAAYSSVSGKETNKLCGYYPNPRSVRQHDSGCCNIM